MQCPQASPKNSSKPMMIVAAAPIRARMRTVLEGALVYANVSPPEITSTTPITVSCPNFMQSPRRPARRPAPKLGSLTVLIEAASLPGLNWPADAGGEHRSVHIALSAKSTERPALARPVRREHRADARRPVPGRLPDW